MKAEHAHGSDVATVYHAALHKAYEEEAESDGVILSLDNS